jgi:hypothetical protein
MKKILSFVIIATLLISSNEANAKIRRVGYFGTPVTGTDYATLQLAHDAASSGDSVFLSPGSWTATINKKLIVLGYGYFIAGAASNANLQSIAGALAVNVTLGGKASTSVFEGIDGLTVLPATDSVVNNITIRRCRGTFYFSNKTYDGWQIVQCYIDNLTYYYGGGKVTNLRVDNCFINSLGLSGLLTIGSNGQFNNDIFYSTNFGNGSYLVKNSVFLLNHVTDINCVYQNSIANTDYAAIPSGNGNQNITGALMSTTVFVGYSTIGSFSNDGRFVLKAGSPAIGTGAGGTDCGIFGGSSPYKLSGIPRIPSFYKVTSTSTSTSTNPYTITFSVRSNN